MPNDQIHFSIKRLLILPIVFAVLFTLFPEREVVTPVVISGAAICGIVLLINRSNWGIILAECVGAFAGIFIFEIFNPSRSLYDVPPSLFFGAISGWLVVMLLGLITRPKRLKIKEAL